jgi:hypothetical protein
MQDWSLHSDNTGGYFQCNRFVESKASEDGGSNDDQTQNMWAEERGNAHAETMRTREKGRKMARFIHHFIRHKAHADSMVMEGKMHRETLRRIEDGLKSCNDGQLKWLQGTIVLNPLAATPAAGATAGGGSLLASPQSKYDPSVYMNNLHKHCIQSCDRCLSFLDEGFEELLKTRCVSHPASMPLARS